MVTNFIQFFTYAEPIACLTALCALYYRKQIPNYKALAVYLGARLAFVSALIPLSLHVGDTLSFAYRWFYFLYWSSYLVEGILAFYVILGAYRLAMAPLAGLERLGMLMFRWASAIAVALAVVMSFAPHVSGQDYFVHMITQLQRTQSILTLCMLIFVCIAIRPMGLTFRSRIFGTSLGLGVMAATDLLNSAWLSSSNHSPFITNLINLASGAAIVLALGLWTAYHAAPEPARRVIVMPATSTFLRWNQISAALQRQSGHTDQGIANPSMFAPAELEIMRRASANPSYALSA